MAEDGVKGYAAGKGNANDDLRATNDEDGSQLRGNDGNDTLRGGRYDDFLIGGEGDDLMFGGAGADQFRFFGNEISGTDTDRIFDLTFGEGDLLVFGRYGAGTFGVDATGINASTDGSGAIISSYEGLANAINNSNGRITFTEKGNTDVLILTINNGEAGTQVIHITAGYDALTAELTPAL